jgi:hypothetical protein
MFCLQHKYNILKPAFLSGETAKSIGLLDMWKFFILFSGDGQDIYLTGKHTLAVS